jgi:hypothetical protein
MWKAGVIGSRVKNLMYSFYGGLHSTMSSVKCTATTASGEPCRNNSSHSDGLCGIHHNMAERIAEDERHRARLNYLAEQEQTERVRQERMQRLRDNDYRLVQATSSSLDDMLRYTRMLGDLWVDYRVPGPTLGLAYCAMRKVSIQHAEWPTLIRAVVNIINVAYFDPDERWWSALRDEEHDVAIERVNAALIPEFRMEPAQCLKVGDRVMEEFQRRHEAERTVTRLAAERAAAEEEERQAVLRRQQENETEQREDFDRRMRTEPMVFNRDPEGGIDLRAFGTDSENVHRSSVQTATQKGLEILMRRQVQIDQETLPEIIAAFQTTVKFGTDARDKAITELTNDYYLTVAFSVSYSDVLDCVWSTIRQNAEPVQLIRRLAQEICEGYKKCVNGKIARLVNVLRGFDAELDDAMTGMPPPREAFQAKFATLLRLRIEERRAAALNVFQEYQIPEDEQPAWLEPLLEA